MPLPQFITLGVVAKMLGLNEAKARYYLSTRNVQPVGMAGRAKVYDEKTILALRDSLAKPKAP